MIGIIATGTEELTCYFQRYFITEEERNDVCQVRQSVWHVLVKRKKNGQY